MKKRKPKHITRENWDAVESPPLTDDQLAAMRPVSEAHPEIVERYRRTRGPQKAPRKVVTTIRLDADVIEYFKAQGRGGPTRINEKRRALTFG